MKVTVCVCVRVLLQPNDFNAFQRFLRERVGSVEISLTEVEGWQRRGLCL